MTGRGKGGGRRFTSQTQAIRSRNASQDRYRVDLA